MRAAHHAALTFSTLLLSHIIKYQDNVTISPAACDVMGWPNTTQAELFLKKYCPEKPAFTAGRKNVIYTQLLGDEINHRFWPFCSSGFGPQLPFQYISSISSYGISKGFLPALGSSQWSCRRKLQSFSHSKSTRTLTSRRGNISCCKLQIFPPSSGIRLRLPIS